MTREQKLASVFIVLAALAGILYIERHKVVAPVTPPEMSTPVATNPETTPEEAQIDRIDPGTNYDLFALEGASYPDYIQYRNVADIQSGEYKGYHRVMGYFTEGPGGPSVFTFATKDYKTFLLDSTIYPYEGYSTPEKDFAAERQVFNKQKVTGIAVLPTNFPKEITMGNFVYVRGTPFIDAPKMETLHPLEATPVSNLSFYNIDSQFITYPSPEARQVSADVLAGEKMAAFSADVVARDDSNLFYRYTFMTAEMYARRNAAKDGSWSEDASKFYIESDLSMDESHYTTYSDLFPGGCGGFGATYAIDGAKNADFISIGETHRGVKLYKPKNPESVLNKAEYSHKVGMYKEYSYWLEANHLTSYPSYDDYILRDPVLVLQDGFGRWVGLGEYDYQLPGGCGKPVVYLYPEKPTAVSVSFETPVKIDRAIPSYANSWNVEAYPDGTLKDLQPHMTLCERINYSLSGAEYAKDACVKGTYPYLYWSGTTANNYPHQKNGWIVSREDLSRFLSAKLSEMGLTEKEKNDMTSFWIPEMENKNAPYYRVAFIQTSEMNTFIPMKVIPTPDSVIRIFLDWQPLSEKPTTDIVPQKLTRVDRKGFTLVEWGGLRQ